MRRREEEGMKEVEREEEEEERMKWERKIRENNDDVKSGTRPPC